MTQENAPQRLWRAEFDKQATTETMVRVIKHAESLVRQLARWTRRPQATTAEDRFHAAIEATLDGRLTWDPSRVDLAGHLIGAIESRISHELRHQRKFVHVTNDPAGPRREDLETEISGALAASRAAPDEESIEDCFAESLAQLRVLAHEDKPVLSLLDAYAQLATERQAVLALTGMSARTYHNARQRLVRLAKKLPVEVREAAIQAMV